MWRCKDIESAKLRASPISRESNLSAARVSSSGAQGFRGIDHYHPF